MQELAPSVCFVERIANPKIFADVSEDSSLKVLLYQMLPSVEMPKIT
jgi:23S rRNA (cytosine1962-C5)-methyltransferase